MVQLILEVPNPKFTKGNIVKYNQYNLKIMGITGSGGFLIRDTGLDLDPSSLITYDYVSEVLEGSRDKDGNIVRQGMTMIWDVGQYEDKFKLV